MEISLVNQHKPRELFRQVANLGWLDECARWGVGICEKNGLGIGRNQRLGRQRIVLFPWNCRVLHFGKIGQHRIERISWIRKRQHVAGR